MFKHIFKISFLSILVFLSIHCQKEQKAVTNEGKVISVGEGKEGIPSVCIWDKASLKSEPTQKGKSISAMALGEKVICLGEDKVDPSDKDRKYFKIRLSDGKEGWVPEYTLALDAKPSVAVQKAVIYLRPDLVTVTDKEFSPMEFIAVTKPENEWCEAKGQEGKKKGWIRSNAISLQDDDITVALLAGKAMSETAKERRKNRIEAIVSNPAFSKSIFLDSLRAYLGETPVVPQVGTSSQDSLKR